MSLARSYVLVILVLVSLVAACTPAMAADGKQAVTLFNGKDFDGWICKGDAPPADGKWSVGIAKLDPSDPRKLVVAPAADGKGELVCVGGGRDMACKQKFGDCTIEVEVMVPKGSNSGIYVMGEYEIQVLDSFGKPKVGPGDMGGVYGNAAPLVNASKAPGEWQQYVIELQAPRFDPSGKKTANAKLTKVTLNGQVIHENMEIKGCTGGPWTGKESSAGPLMFQGNHGPVAFRNVRITPAK